MNRKITARVSAAVLFILLGVVAYTQNPGAPPELKITKVRESLYVIEGDGGNVAVYVTGNGVILVDDKFERDHDAIMGIMQRLTAQPLKYVLNTHHHADHSGGNARMYDSGAQIISTVNSRKNILERRQSNAPPNVLPARIVFTEETSVFLGGKEVRAHHYGRGHTNGDAIIYFPLLKVIHAGDLMSGATPLIDYNAGGSVIEWTKTLDTAMQALDFDTVIPGHGPITNRAGLQNYRDNIAKIRESVTEQIHQGKTQGDIAKFMEIEHKWAPTSLQQQLSVPGFMNELK
ncbi:MAG: MBL fold metallo-hydrolase [Bryobacterales bacterium]|nr:MBL fold metallo-hydrolase [Bryobacterales bacterium]